MNDFFKSSVISENLQLFSTVLCIPYSQPDRVINIKFVRPNLSFISQKIFRVM